MMRVQITDDQRGELAQVSRQAVGRVALRAQMVLLAARGYSVPRIAEVHDCGQDVVRLWLHRYSEEGVHGLEDTPSTSPRPPRRPPERASGGQPGHEGHGRVPALGASAFVLQQSFAPRS